MSYLETMVLPDNVSLDFRVTEKQRLHSVDCSDSLQKIAEDLKKEVQKLQVSFKISSKPTIFFTNSYCLSVFSNYF